MGKEREKESHESVKGGKERGKECHVCERGGKERGKECHVRESAEKARRLWQILTSFRKTRPWLYGARGSNLGAQLSTSKKQNNIVIKSSKSTSFFRCGLTLRGGHVDRRGDIAKSLEEA